MKKTKHNNGCVICGVWEVDSCHIRSRGAMGSSEERNIFYACRLHHIEQHTIGINKMAIKYDRFKKMLEVKGWEFCPVLLRWTHVLERPDIE